MATLLTHLGLILFLVAAAVTSRLGNEQGLVVPEGESLTVQPIGTPGLLLVKNLGFEAPGFETGMPTDFTTDLAVYQDGQEIARKTIRVNDPLSVGGYTFHQNGFGPAPHLVVRDAAGGRCGTRRSRDRLGGRAALRDPRRARSRPRAAAAARPATTTGVGRPLSCRTGSSARTPTVRSHPRELPPVTCTRRHRARPSSASRSS